MFNVPFLKKQCKRNTDTSLRVGEYKIKLIIGLGNPGKEYKNTYHNIGFLLLDFLLKSAPGNATGTQGEWESKKLFRYKNIGSITLVKPSVFMNRSGGAVYAILKCFDIKPEEALIIHDESDIEIGNYKFSFGRGTAGHKGIESIAHFLGTNKFPRLRIGVRHDKRKAGKFVLEKITKSHSANLEKIFKEIREKLIS